MRYKIPVDRLINQLVPHFLSGRKYILMLQSLAYPLQALNDSFVSFAKVKDIEARMTSQVLYFEWYLNHKFSRYFTDHNERIFLSDSDSLGVEIYKESSNFIKPFTIWAENEIVATSNPDEEPKPLFKIAEDKTINNVSFTVNVPSINITEFDFVCLLTFEVNRYKIAGMTYNIKITQE